MMTFYFTICAFMLAVVYIRIWGEFIDFKKAHPNARFIKPNFAQTVVNIIKLILYFTCPILNVLLFIGVLFVIPDSRIQEVIAEKCEVL